jgi:hypothetical protein
VAIKAYRTIREAPNARSSEPRSLEPAIIGMIGETAVQLGFAGMPGPVAMQQIARTIPQVNVNEYLRKIAFESLKGVEKIRERLGKEYGEVAILGRGEGRHPDLAGLVKPDFIALSGKNRDPIIVETKDSTRESPSDRFQAMFYNGIADKFGVYLLEERLENGFTKLSPRLIQSKAETILIYPRLARYSIVKENFVPDQLLIKEIWKVKELGYKGLAPETDCGKDCAHHRFKVNLPEEDMEPLPPPSLIFSGGMLEHGYDLDTSYQVNYAWKVLPSQVKHVLFSSWRQVVTGLDELKDWLVKVAGLDYEAADIVLNLDKWEAFLRSKPDADMLLNLMKSELEPLEDILKKRLKVAAPVILARATAVYSLPSRSFRFVKDAWKRWQ